MVEFIKGILRWIILAIIIILIIVLLYNISNASSKKSRTNNNYESGTRVIKKTKDKNKETETTKESTTESETTTETTSTDKELAVLEETHDEVSTPDTASNSGITVFLGVFTLAGTTYYLLINNNIIKSL